MAFTRSRAKEAQKSGGTGRVDRVLLILVAILTVVGLIMISSASVVMSKTVANSDNYYFFTQLAAGAVGILLLYIGSRIDYQVWKKFALPFLIINVFFLLIVFVPGLGFQHNGASRWISIGPLNFQPSESIKLALILFFASWLESKGDDIRDIRKGTAPFLVILGIVLTLVLAQPDMGTATVLAVTAGAMYFISGAKPSHILALLGAAIAGIIVLIKAAPYRMARLTIFLNPTSDKSGAGYQISQALLAIGSGGIWGLGFGKSRQKFNYLPEASTDSIFAVISEELGLIRASMVVLLFLLFAFRGYKIAKGAPDTFARLTAVGITTWVISQAFINILAILSLMPLTGVPLPFISYGGSSLVMLLAACGILLNISKHTANGGENENSRVGGRNWWSYITGTRSSYRASKAR